MYKLMYSKTISVRHSSLGFREQFLLFINKLDTSVMQTLSRLYTGFGVCIKGVRLNSLTLLAFLNQQLLSQHFVSVFVVHFSFGYEASIWIKIELYFLFSQNYTSEPLSFKEAFLCPIKEASLCPNSAHSHWLLRGHITYNNETVSHQNLWARNTAKSMTLEGSIAHFNFGYVASTEIK